MIEQEKSSTVAFWCSHIDQYNKDYRNWTDRTKKIIKRYRDDSKDYEATNPARFNILWSNVQVAIPATFSRLPKPDVSRRHRDNDPVGRVAALIMERGLEYEIEHYPDYRAAMKGSVFDRFLGGRGVSWVRYEPHFKASEQGTPEDGFQITEDADEAEQSEDDQEELDYECSPVDYVHWKDFGHVIARTWEEVPAVWRRVYMTRAALIKRFGEEIGSKIPLDTRPDDDKKSQNSDSELFQACVYEIWDKETNAAIWISKSQTEKLDAREDPLKLECFFPCPRPLFATITTDSLIPVPDFAMYQDQAAELDELAQTIASLIRSLKIKGVHDAAIPELARLFTEAGNGDLIPVKTWSAFAEKNGLKGAIDIVDLTPIGNALVAAYAAVEHVKQQIYEITGLSDVVRASSDPRETATAIKSKGQFGSMRLRAMQGDVVQYATEILQIKAQIMAGQYSDDTLVQISGAMQLSQQDQQLIGPALQLIRNNPLRNFRIEVSSDSMIQMDEAQEKQDRMELMDSSGKNLQALVQISQSPLATEMLPIAIDLMKFSVGGFKIGKSLEGAFNQLGDTLRDAAAKKAAQPPAPPPPDPRIQVAQMNLQADAQKFQAQQAADQQAQQFAAQAEQQKLAMEAQLEQQKMAAARDKEMAQMQADQAVEAARAQAEMQIEQNRMQLDAQLEAVKAQAATEAERMRMEFEARLEQYKAEQSASKDLILAQMNNATKINVAQIGKQGGTLDPSQDVAARGAADDRGVD